MKHIELTEVRTLSVNPDKPLKKVHNTGETPISITGMRSDGSVAFEVTIPPGETCEIVYEDAEDGK